MITLATLQCELIEAVLMYCKYAESMEKSGFERIYDTTHILAINQIINSRTKIVLLHGDMIEYLDKRSPRPFSERVRYAFGIAKDYDLHNNLVKILLQPKYNQDKLELIDERAQWNEEYETRVKNLRQELLEHPEVIVNAEISRLRKANAELTATIEGLQIELRTAQQERDQLRNLYHATKKQCNQIKEEKIICERKLDAAIIENKRLKKSLSELSKNQNNPGPKTSPNYSVPRK